MAVFAPFCAAASHPRLASLESAPRPQLGSKRSESDEVSTATANNSPLLTPDEVAKALRVHVSWVYAHQQEIPGFVRLGRYVRFRRVAIDEFLHAKTSCQ
jgi:excisionase family DNA binding protein